MPEARTLGRISMVYRLLHFYKVQATRLFQIPFPGSGGSKRPFNQDSMEQKILRTGFAVTHFFKKIKLNI
jgi:hypothetical protein